MPVCSVLNSGELLRRLAVKFARWILPVHLIPLPNRMSKFADTVWTTYIGRNVSSAIKD